MARYTVELIDLVEKGYDVGLSSYPLFDENYRPTLNRKITEHYAFREIGLETPALFSRFMARKMNEIMKYYNKLYESELIKIDALTRLDYSEEFDREGNAASTSTAEANGSGSSRDVSSNTPQGLLSMPSIENEVYATNAMIGKTTSDSTSSANNTTDSTDHYIKKIVGNNAGRTDAQMLKEFRETFLNIDMQIVEELEPLFMQIW